MPRRRYKGQFECRRTGNRGDGDPGDFSEKREDLKRVHSQWAMSIRASEFPDELEYSKVGNHDPR